MKILSHNIRWPKLRDHPFKTYSTTHQRSVEVQFGRYQKNILQESSMTKKLSCVSCGSLKRFPHTFTNMGDICEIRKKDGRLFETHSFTDSTFHRSAWQLWIVQKANYPQEPGWIPFLNPLHPGLWGGTLGWTPRIWPLLEEGVHRGYMGSFLRFRKTFHSTVRES